MIPRVRRRERARGGVRLLRLLVSFILAVPLHGCVSLQQVAPPQAALFESDSLAAEPAATEPAKPLAFVGIELEEVLLGSLDDAFDFADGLRVASVATGSPAESAGLRTGDKVLRAAHGAEASSAVWTSLSDLDQWSAVLHDLAPSAPLLLEVERDHGVQPVCIHAGSRGEGPLPPPRLFREGRRGRFLAETVRTDAGPARARIVSLEDNSPLADADIAPGDLLLAMDDIPLDGALDLARRVAAAPYGSAAKLLVQSGAAAEPRRVKVTWWEPDRHVARLALPILFDYRSDPARATRHWDVLDLWLISLFSYDRDGATRRYRFLRFVQFETGVGELTEVGERR